MMRKTFLICLISIVVGCTNINNDVPITDGWRQTLGSPQTYTVKKSDTVYSIAWRYGLDYRELATLNGLDSSYRIKAGQKLRLSSSARTAAVGTTTQKKTTTDKTVDTSLDNVATSSIHWVWPTDSHDVINRFSAVNLNKGIDIVGKLDSPVFAAAAGKVVYSGSSLRGYGNLLIIKHNAEFLSAYAHNQKLLVREGDSVERGQVIAKMGDTEAKRVMLHFEIRKAGKPVDPLKYL